MKLNLIISALTLAALTTVSAQTFGSPYDPQIASMIVEGRVPLSNLLSDSPNALNIPPDIAARIQSGALEIRGRVEFNRAERSVRIYQFVAPPSAPYPLPESPSISDPAVAIVFDLSIEHIHWFEYESANPGPARRNVTIVGRRLGLLKGQQTLPEEFGVVQLAWDRNDPTAIRQFTVAFAGSLVGFASSPVGKVVLDPFRSPL